VDCWHIREGEDLYGLFQQAPPMGGSDGADEQAQPDEGLGPSGPGSSADGGLHAVGHDMGPSSYMMDDMI
jgi:hypothetical protein